MVRQMCSFPETQMEFLEAEAARTGLPVTELLRSIVREHMETKRPGKKEPPKEK